MHGQQASSVTGAVRAAFERRRALGMALVGDASRIASACLDMSRRFHRGGKLIVFGTGGPSTDAQHVSVEFVHPVIVGKRALPAISLTNDIATVTGIAEREGVREVFAHQLRHLAESDDIALGISADGRSPSVLRGLEVAHDRGLLTIALAGGDGGAIAASPAVDHAMVVASDDAPLVKETHTTVYHVLWELAHVLFEQPGLLDEEARS